MCSSLVSLFLALFCLLGFAMDATLLSIVRWAQSPYSVFYTASLEIDVVTRGSPARHHTDMTS